MYKTIKRIKAGGGRPEDLDVLDGMSRNMGIMPGTTICGLADGAAWPIKNALAKFRPEMENYIRTHQTPGARVTPLQEALFQGRPGNPVILHQLELGNRTDQRLALSMQAPN